MTLLLSIDEDKISTDDIDLTITDFENILNVYQDGRSNWFYNLNLTTKIKADKSLLKKYTCITDSHWPLISYNIYGTTRLAWLLIQLNDVPARNVFNPILAGEQVYYLANELLHTVLEELQNYSN